MKVFLVAAITADGYIGLSDSHLSTKWTSKEDTQFFRSFSKNIKHMVVGSKTFATFNRKMDGRKFFVYSRNESIENPHDNDIEVTKEEPSALIARLEDQGVEQVLISGGSSIYTQFMEDGVVDELYLTIEPIVFGEGVKLFNQPLEQKLELLEIIDLSEQTKVLHYKVVR